MEKFQGSIFDFALQRNFPAAELNNLLAQRVAHFQKMGLRVGDRAVLAQGNSAAFFVDLVALWKLGICVAPVGEHLAPALLQQCAKQIGACMLVTSKDCNRLDFLLPEEPQADSALILFTSGSTGKPRAVLHTFAGIRAKLNTLAHHIPAGDIQRTFCFLPTHFGHGLICNSLFPLSVGADLIIAPPFEAKTLAGLGAILDQHAITFMSSVPSVWRFVAQLETAPAKQQSLRRAHCASEPLSPELLQEVKKWAGPNVLVKNIYGTTELGGWMGEIQSGVDIWDGEAKLCQEGMIWVRAPGLMQGYIGEPELTKRYLQDGWFCTGDNGRIDASGLILLGRNDHRINRAGSKVNPEEIEAVLQSSSLVQDCCAFGISDPIVGESIAAAVVWKSLPGNSQELDLWCRKHLQAHKVPSKWFGLARIPRNERGKLERSAVKKECLDS